MARKKRLKVCQKEKDLKLNRRKHKPFEKGDLVRFSKYTPDYPGQSGIVLDRIHYVFKENAHPDEYSCMIKLLGSEKIVMMRAKWLRLMSR